MRRAFRIGVLAAVGITLALTPRGPASTQGAEACGPYALDFAFVRVALPDDPQAYAAGAIGVVRPSFRLPWLVTAYRHLAGQPLGAAAQRALAGPEEPGVRLPPGTLFGMQRWLKARSDALKEPEAALAHPARGVRPGDAAPTSTTAPKAPSRPRRRPCRSASPRWRRHARRRRLGRRAGSGVGQLRPRSQVRGAHPGRARRRGDAAGARRSRLPDRDGVVLRRPVGRRGDSLPRHRRGSDLAVAAVGRVPRRARVPAQGHDRRR